MSEKMPIESQVDLFSREALEAEREIFENYLSNLGISQEELRGKKILDVGAGRRYFAAHVLRENLTDTVFSLDPVTEDHREVDKQWSSMDKEMQIKVKARTIKAVKEAIPLKANSIDLVVANCMPISKYAGYAAEAEAMRDEVEKMFDEFISVLAPGGELRYFALRRYEDPRRDPRATNWRVGIMEKLAKLKKNGFEVAIEEAKKDKQEDGSWKVWDRIVLRKPQK